MRFKKCILSVLFYGLTIWLLYRYVQLDDSIEEYMTVWQRLSYALLISIFLYCGSRIMVKGMIRKNRKRWLYITFVLIFLLYMMNVLQLTLFDTALGRTSTMAWSIDNVIAYCKETANIKPLYD